MSQAALNRPEESSGPIRDRVPGRPGGRLPRFADAAMSRARLSLVAPSRREAPLAPFVVVLFVVLMGGVAGLLTFNTSMQQTSFGATRLEDHAAALSAKRQSLQMQLAALGDPQALATRAKALGMVPATSPAFIRLSDGRVLGNPQPAAPAQAMRIDPLPAAKPKVLAPAPKVITAPRPSKKQSTDQRGADRSGRSSTDDRTSTSGPTQGGQG